MSSTGSSGQTVKLPDTDRKAVRHLYHWIGSNLGNTRIDASHSMTPKDSGPHHLALANLEINLINAQFGQTQSWRVTSGLCRRSPRIWNPYVRYFLVTLPLLEALQHQFNVARPVTWLSPRARRGPRD
jgi:hypothetical protein